MSEPNFIQNGNAANNIIGTATFPPVFCDFSCPENLIPACNLWQNGPVIYCETNVVNNFLPPEFYGLNMNYVPGPETNNGDMFYNEAYLPNHIHGRPLLPNDASNNLPLYRIPKPYGNNTLNNHVKDQTWYNATSDFINNHQTRTDNTKINKIESNKRYDKHANNMEQRLKTYIDDLWVKNVEKMIDEAALGKRKVEEKKKNKCSEDSSSTSMAIRRYNNYQRFLYNYPNKYGDLPKRRHSVETESTTLDANIGKKTKAKISYIDIEKRSKSKHIKETIEKTYDKGRPGKVVKTYKKKIEKLCKSHIKQINETFRIKYSKYETEKGTQNEDDSKKKQKTHSKQDIEKGIDIHNEETDKNGCKKNVRNEISSENCNQLNDETKIDTGNDFKKEKKKNEYPKKNISIKINKNIQDKYDFKKISKSNFEDMKNTYNLHENKSMLKVDIEPENSVNNTITQKTDITNNTLNIDKYETISIPDDETEEIETKENQSEINNISGLTETKDIHDVSNEIENKPELYNKSNMKLKGKDILSPTKDNETKNNNVDIKQIFPEEKITNNLLDDGEIERRTSINLKRPKLNTNNTELSPVKSKPKPKKTKRIKLVIQYIESPSDSSDSDQPTRHSPTHDISFLDDFNVDEIVDSLNVNNKHDDTTITSKNIDGENISEFHTPGRETISQVNKIGEANLRRGKTDTECKDQITIIEEKEDINQRSTTLENIKPDGKGETCANIYKYIIESYKDQRPPMEPPVTVNSKHTFGAKKFMGCNNFNKNIIDISEEEPTNSDNVNGENTIKSNANNSNLNAQSHTCDIADIYKFLHESYEAHQNKLSLNKNNRDVENGNTINSNDVIVIEEDKSDKIIEISDDECCSSNKNSNKNKIQLSKVSMHCLSNSLCAAEEKINPTQKPNFGIDSMINSTNEPRKPLHSLNVSNSYITDDIVVADIINIVKNKTNDPTTIKTLEKNEKIESLTQCISEPIKNISVQSQNQFYTTSVNKRKEHKHEILDHLENIKTNNAQKSTKGKTINKVKKGKEKDNTIAKDRKHDNLRKGKHTNGGLVNAQETCLIHDDTHSRNKKSLSLSSNKINKTIPKDSLHITNCKSDKLPKKPHVLKIIKENAKKYKNVNKGSESMLITDLKNKIDSSKAIYDSEVKNTAQNTVDSKINQYKNKAIKPNNTNTSQKIIVFSNMVEQINIPENHYRNRKAIHKPEKHKINIENNKTFEESDQNIRDKTEIISNSGVSKDTITKDALNYNIKMNTLSVNNQSSKTISQNANTIEKTTPKDKVTLNSSHTKKRKINKTKLKKYYIIKKTKQTTKKRNKDEITDHIKRNISKTYMKNVDNKTSNIDKTDSKNTVTPSIVISAKGVRKDITKKINDMVNQISALQGGTTKIENNENEEKRSNMTIASNKQTNSRTIVRTHITNINSEITFQSSNNDNITDTKSTNNEIISNGEVKVKNICKKLALKNVENNSKPTNNEINNMDSESNLNKSNLCHKITSKSIESNSKQLKKFITMIDGGAGVKTNHYNKITLKNKENTTKASNLTLSSKEHANATNIDNGNETNKINNNHSKNTSFNNKEMNTYHINKEKMSINGKAEVKKINDCNKIATKKMENNLKSTNKQINNMLTISIPVTEIHAYKINVATDDKKSNDCKIINSKNKENSTKPTDKDITKKNGKADVKNSNDRNKITPKIMEVHKKNKNNVNGKVDDKTSNKIRYKITEVDTKNITKINDKADKTTLKNVNSTNPVNSEVTNINDEADIKEPNPCYKATSTHIKMNTRPNNKEIINVNGEADVKDSNQHNKICSKNEENNNTSNYEIINISSEAKEDSKHCIETMSKNTDDNLNAELIDSAKQCQNTMPSVKTILTTNEQRSNIDIDHSKTDNGSKNTPLKELTTNVKPDIENESKTTKEDKNNDHLECAGGDTNVPNNIQDNICEDSGTVEDTVTRTSNANIDTIDVKNEKAPTENNICKDNETIEDKVTRTSYANTDTIDIKNEKAPVEKVIDALNVENIKNISDSSKESEAMPSDTEDNKRLKEKIDEDTMKVDDPKTTDSINTNKILEENIKLAPLSDTRNTKMNTNTVQNAKLFKKLPQIGISRKKAKPTPKSSVSTLHKVIKHKCHKGIKSVVKSKKGADVFSPHASTSRDSHENNEFYLEDDYRLTVQDRMHQYLNKRFVVGPLINGGYFSNMYKCQDIHKNHFALKILHERFYDAGLNKDKILLKLQNTTDRKSSLLKVCHSFNMNGSWCFLMYYYPQNLEMALQHGRCIHIDLVQKLSMQLVDAVRVLTLNGLIHADINPRHILLNGQGDRLKLGGFDKLSYASGIQINPSTSKINYRAPEVVLGFEADFRIDVWATALVMYEMSTGTKLFPATYNTDLLFKQLCTMGSIDYGMLQYCKYRRIYFHESSFIKRRANNKYHLVHEIVRNNILRDSIFASYHTAFGRHRSQWQVTQDLDKLEMFHGLLEKMLVLDPRFRLPITFVAASEFIQYNN